MTAPEINVHTFPYRRKWEKTELDDVYARFERIQYVLTDPVGPSGQVLYLPPEMVAILALHASLAGVDVHDDAAFIWGRKRPDENGMWADTVEWVVKKDESPPPAGPPLDEAEAEAETLAAQIKRQLPPEVREALRRKLAAEFETEMKDGDE